jgi:hypothetical protein
MKPDDFRKSALAFPDAEESAHMGHPDFRISGKIFATLGAPNEKWGMVKLTPEQQRAFLEGCPEIFKPASGAWGRSGCTHVLLSLVKKDIAKAALEMAYENVLAAAKPRKPKTGAKKKTKKTTGTARTKKTKKDGK